MREIVKSSTTPNVPLLGTKPEGSRTIFWASLWLVGLNLIASGLLFVTSITVSRLGTEDFGIYVAFLGVLTILGAFPNTIQTIAITLAARGMILRTQYLNPLFRRRLLELFGVMLATLCAFIGVMYIFRETVAFPQASYGILVLITLAIDGLFAASQGILQGYEHQIVAGVLGVGWAGLRFLLTLFAIVWFQDLFGAIVALSVSRFIIFIPGLMLVIWFGAKSRSSSNVANHYASNENEQLAFALPTFAALCLLQLDGFLPVVIARIRMSSFDAGIFSSAAVLANLMPILAIVATVLVFPKLVKDKHTEQQRYLVARVSTVLLVLGFIAAFLIHLISSGLVSLLFGERYLPASSFVGGLVFAASLQGVALFWTYVQVAAQHLNFLFVLFIATMLQAFGLLICPPQALFFIIVISICNLGVIVIAWWQFHRNYKRKKFVAE